VKGVFIIAYDQNRGHCSSLKIQPNGAGGMAGKKKKCSKEVSVEKKCSKVVTM